MHYIVERASNRSPKGYVIARSRLFHLVAELLQESSLSSMSRSLLFYALRKLVNTLP